VERWRLFVALGAALAALPLLAIDNVSSAEGRVESPKVEVLGVTAERTDLALDLLASRASSWAVARENARQHAVDEAVSISEQARADESARLSEQALAATETALRSEQDKKAEATRKAADAARKAAAEAAARRASTTTAKPAPKVITTQRSATSGEPTAAQWAKLRQCESSNNYTSVSAGGRFHGAYQFSQATWDWVAVQVAPQLVGVDPVEAAPGDQDNMALNLYRMRGASQWPVCGTRLL
jgi:Transglycosylase-like domain